VDETILPDEFDVAELQDWLSGLNPHIDTSCVEIYQPKSIE